MQSIHPIDVNNCRNLIGKTVLLYLTNGLEFHGTLSRVEKNKLILNANQPVKLSSATKSTKPVSSKKGKKKPIQPNPSLQVTPAHQLSSFGLPLFGSWISGPEVAPAAEPVTGAPGPVDIHMDRIAAMFTV
ncbi:hypothetical protein [Paenibacillus roseipurpureus]|uniref:LSM domain-containing protein n=1 Tax=Paenibacillus roseopurpureus TaxID=2918901 RepID=A0AA96LQM3_9BACL|nr:hypothetical protein [Paenibacillus sp. MBLB1832]WNR45526.1 hypothetical protein MJB10_05315 [Paenibacillus sp. MBLB1832]